MAPLPPRPHHWYSPGEIAALLDARAYTNLWRARCPAHGGDNPTALTIREGTSQDGLPMTLLHCHAHQCPVEEICRALGITVAELFVSRPDRAPRSPEAQRLWHHPASRQLAQSPDPATPDDIAELLLIEMIASDPAWFETCVPARRTCLRLGQDPARKIRLSRAFRAAGWHAERVWQTLGQEATYDSTPT